MIEGLDGAGKSTQVGRLRSYLEGFGALEYVHFPRYDAPVYGGLISRYLSGEFGSLQEVHPQLVALLFAEDRHGAAPLLRASLEQGRIVLLDRYVYSNIAYQCSKLRDEGQARRLAEWILQTEYGQFALPRPDLNIFLDVPLSFVRGNLSADREGRDRDYLKGSADIHEADLSLQERVRERYLSLVESDPKFLRLDCSDGEGGILPQEEIFFRLKAVVDKVLQNNI